MSLPIFHNNLYEFMIDDRSYTHNISSCEIKAWKKKKKNQAWTGFQPMTSAIPVVQCSTRQLSYQAIWRLVTLWVRNIPVESEGCK